jgi:hypothetical protein
VQVYKRDNHCFGVKALRIKAAADLRPKLDMLFSEGSYSCGKKASAITAIARNARVASRMGLRPVSKRLPRRSFIGMPL